MIYYKFLFIYIILNIANKILSIIKIANIFVNIWKSCKSNIILISLLKLKRKINLKIIKSNN